jgi:hypothetical protein
LAQGDEDFIADTIEGETNLFEIIGRMVEAEGEDKAVLEGLGTYIESLKCRADRIKKRIETRRILLASVIDRVGVKSIPTRTGKISLSPVAPTVIVQDESVIPTRFWKAGEPKLDRRALAEAIKAKEEVPGATMSNGGFTIRITRN